MTTSISVPGSTAQFPVPADLDGFWMFVSRRGQKDDPGSLRPLGRRSIGREAVTAAPPQPSRHLPEGPVCRAARRDRKAATHLTLVVYRLLTPPSRRSAS